MKRLHILTILAALTLLLCCLLPTKAEAATSGYFTYEVSDGKATITDCSTSISGNVTIPSTLGGYPVTCIGATAFRDCSSLTSITIPDSVTSIGESAFYNCSNLISAIFGEDSQLTRIGSFAFQRCSNLTSIKIPNSVSSIGEFAFCNCDGLASVTIPAGITIIGCSVFSDCYSLTSVTIPNSVISLDSFAFWNCINLTSIIIPDSVTSIGYAAFENCNKLSHVAYTGSQSQWNRITFDSSNSELTEATRHYETVFQTLDNCMETSTYCPVCQITLTRTEKPDGSHSFATATCTTPKTCSACGAVEGAALGHSWSDWQVIRANTCTEPGLQSRVCKVCGEEETKEIPAAHVYGAYVVTLAPTCLDAGTKTRTCTICGNVDTQTVAPLRGLSEEVIDPKLYPYPESSHDYPNNVNETKTFTYPGAEKLTITFSVSSVTESNYDKVYIYDANGSQLTVYTGSLSGKTLTITGDTFKIKLTSDGSVQKWGYSFSSIVAHKTPTHTWGEWKETTAPTCKEKGTETRTCSYCGLQESREGTALVGHSGQWMELVPATCTTDGINARICTICGETETETVVATGHSYSAVVTAPTCTEKGYTTKTCATCGEIFITDYVDAIGHSYSSVVVEPTCTEQGYTTKTCATCGDVTTEYVPAKGHGWSAWITTVKPTCTTEGAQMRFCNCGTRETEVIAKLPHSCENYICTVCGELDYANTVLTGAVQANWNLTQDLYIDLNGFDLSGTIITNGFKVYGMDRTTDNYTCDSIGYFTCVDENGNLIVPERIYTEGEKQYMAICTEDRYSFHRFFVGTTHMSLEPEAIGLGYKAAVFGDEMVFAELAETKAFSFKLQLEGYNPVYRHFDSSELTSGESIALRIRNYDVENYSEHTLYAQVSLNLSDGTVIEAEQVALTFRWLTEQVNANYTDYTNEQIAQFKAMLQAFDVVKKWDIPNLI